MNEWTLTYFDFDGGRGEECRLALNIAGVHFTDDRIPVGSWVERKPSTPFGAVPVLDVPGEGLLADSTAIIRYIGRAHGLHPDDPMEAARHDAIMAEAETLRQTVAPSLFERDQTKKKAMRETLALSYLPRWAGQIERQIAGPFISGERLHVADLKLYVVARWFISGTLDHVPSDVFDAFEILTRLHDAVAAHPGVLDWYAKRRSRAGSADTT